MWTLLHERFAADPVAALASGSLVAGPVGPDGPRECCYLALHAMLLSVLGQNAKGAARRVPHR